MPLIALVLALLHHRVKEGRVVFDFDVNLAVNQVIALLHYRVKEGRVVFDFDVNLAVNQREAKWTIYSCLQLEAL